MASTQYQSPTYETVTDQLDKAMQELSRVSRDLVSIPHPDQPHQEAVVYSLEIRATVAQLEVVYAELVNRVKEQRMRDELRELRRG